MRVRYCTLEFPDFDLHVRSLRDTQEFDDVGGEAAALGISSATWSTFGVLWDSGRVLAGVMTDVDIAGLRILEVGCGLGLPSLVLNHRQADITATDLHPSAGRFLARNAALNDDEPIPFVRTGWTDDDHGLGLFDLIIGADVLYEAPHVRMLSDFVHEHLAPGGQVVLVDPGRKLHARFSRRMVELGYAHEQRRVPSDESEHAVAGTRVLTYDRPA